jgi:hypothetical protein
LQRLFVVAGQELITASLGQPMDMAFDRLNAAYFGKGSFSWEEFIPAALHYFDANPNSAAAHNHYFNAFTHIWQMFLGAGNLDRAAGLWERALQPVKLWEKAHPGLEVHKGTAYYFWAMTVLMQGDTDRGYLLAHQALSEDVRTCGVPFPDTPAYALVSLNFEKVDQAFRDWVIAHAAFFDHFVQNYASTLQSTLTINDVKRRFMDCPPSVDVVFLLTFTLARLVRLSTMTKREIDNRFAGQLELNLLVDLALVIETAIRSKNSTTKQRPTFIDHAEHLLTRSGHPLTRDQLGNINDQFNKNFDSALSAVVDGTINVPGTNGLDRLQRDVAMAYGIRNHGSHNIDKEEAIWKNFAAVQESAFRSLCATIDFLY